MRAQVRGGILVRGVHIVRERERDKRRGVGKRARRDGGAASCTIRVEGWRERGGGTL